MFPFPECRAGPMLPPGGAAIQETEGQQVWVRVRVWMRMRVWVRTQVGKAVPPAEMHAGEMAAYSYGLTYCLAHCSLADCVPSIYCTPCGLRAIYKKGDGVVPSRTLCGVPLLSWWAA